MIKWYGINGLTSDTERVFAGYNTETKAISIWNNHTYDFMDVSIAECACINKLVKAGLADNEILYSINQALDCLFANEEV